MALKTFLYADKNSSCVLTLSAPSEEAAEVLLEEKVINPEDWRLEEIDEEE